MKEYYLVCLVLLSYFTTDRNSKMLSYMCVTILVLQDIFVTRVPKTGIDFFIAVSIAEICALCLLFYKRDVHNNRLIYIPFVFALGSNIGYGYFYHYQPDLYLDWYKYYGYVNLLAYESIVFICAYFTTFNAGFILKIKEQIYDRIINHFTR